MKRIPFKILALSAILLLSIFVKAQKQSVIWVNDSSWAEDKLKEMSLDEKLGQLFMVAAYSNKNEAHEEEIRKLVKDYHIGGLIFMQGGPVRQARLTNSYQQMAKVPLMIAMDAEWGLSMRLDSTFKFPWPLTLGAMKDTTMAYHMGREIAKHCKRLGVHVNFGPVVDINTNANNPIINARSFGENPEKVTAMAKAYMHGMQDAGVLACAKHFPGHGDTDADSHKTLPIVGHTIDRLRAVELYPYKVLMESGLGSIMAAHLNVPAMDNSGVPSSLSKPILTSYLRDTLKFDGLVFTDALNMQGVAAKYAPGIVDVKALLAGNDVLLFSQNVPLAIEKLKEALKNKELTEEVLDEHVLRILRAKYFLGLYEKRYVEPTHLVEDLHPESSEIVTRHIFKEAITVVTNREKLIPVEKLEGKKIAVVTMGTEEGKEFGRTLNFYAKVDQYNFNGSNAEALYNKLSNYDLVIAGIYTSNTNPWKSYKISTADKAFIKRLSLQNKIIINLFGNPYGLKDFPEAERADALMVSYQNHPDAESLSAQIIFGALGAVGRLPVTSSNLFGAGFGLNTPSLNRMGYGLPGEVGLDRNELLKIDLLVEEAIRKRATPGAQVLVAKEGQVVYMKNFGYHTYSKKEKVEDHDIYDLASITKISASLPLIMKLVEEGKIDIDKTIGDYLPKAKGTNKENIVIREMLAHQARLQPWIPFYLSTLKDGGQLPEYYSHTRTFNYPNVVARDLYSVRSVEDTIIKAILDSKLLPAKEYKYSDLGYYLMMEIIEEVEGRPINELADEYFYQPLGAYTMTFRPEEKFPDNVIIPTEDDKAFRKQELLGYVHDQGAAMLGGVAGHAGLFSNANDLAKLMQMYMQYGTYGGIEYFDSVTVKEFARCQYCDDDNRRGIGFDKPQLGGPGPTCGCVSPLSFGHSGFTGTLAWADPTEKIVYVFLSNRVHPDAENRLLLSLSTRTKIQQVIYDAIIHEEDIDSKLIGALQP